MALRTAQQRAAAMDVPHGCERAGRPPQLDERGALLKKSPDQLFAARRDALALPARVGDVAFGDNQLALAQAREGNRHRPLCQRELLNKLTYGRLPEQLYGDEDLKRIGLQTIKAAALVQTPRSRRWCDERF